VDGVRTKLAARKTASVSLALGLAAAGLMGLGITGAGLAGTAAAAAVPAHASSKSAVVVKERRHAPFGKILYTTHGRALYYLPSGSCTGECLSIWPPLKMPKGKTVPKGAGCLRTVRFGRGRQVTYNHHRLYTFVDDSGSSVTGNGVAGFKVAKVVRCR
jgi:predicted lipoprotein with Yx(FWY)xxD motif